MTDDVDRALAEAVHDKLGDGSVAGPVPAASGTVAVGSTLRGCEEEPRSVLGDWILIGLKLGYPLPVVAGIDPNQEPSAEPVDAS